MGNPFEYYDDGTNLNDRINLMSEYVAKSLKVDEDVMRFQKQ